MAFLRVIWQQNFLSIRMSNGNRMYAAETDTQTTQEWILSARCLQSGDMPNVKCMACINIYTGFLISLFVFPVLYSSLNHIVRSATVYTRILFASGLWRVDDGGNSCRGRPVHTDYQRACACTFVSTNEHTHKLHHRVADGSPYSAPEIANTAHGRIAAQQRMGFYLYKRGGETRRGGIHIPWDCGGGSKIRWWKLCSVIKESGTSW